MGDNGGFIPGEPQDPPQDPPKEDPPKSDDSPPTSAPSAPSEPAVDPVVAQKMNLFRQVYISLWGEPPTEAYIKSAANSGMNSWEFARQERNKPAWADTDVYKKKADELATMLANLGVG